MIALHVLCSGNTHYLTERDNCQPEAGCSFSCFPIFRFRAYLIEVFPEKRRALKIWYLRFNYYANNVAVISSGFLWTHLCQYFSLHMKQII